MRPTDRPAVTLSTSPRAAKGVARLSTARDQLWTRGIRFPLGTRSAADSHPGASSATRDRDRHGQRSRPDRWFPPCGGAYHRSVKPQASANRLTASRCLTAAFSATPSSPDAAARQAGQWHPNLRRSAQPRSARHRSKRPRLHRPAAVGNSANSQRCPGLGATSVDAASGKAAEAGPSNGT